MADNQKKIKELHKILEEVEAYNRCLGKVYFDMECCSSQEGMDQAGEDMAIVGKHIHKLLHSKKYVRLITELHEDSEGLTFLQKKLVDRLYEDYCKTKNYSEKFVYEMQAAAGKAYGQWLQAKKANDFSLFKDSFKEVIEFTRKAIDLRDEKKDTYYNNCLDEYEKGGNEKQLDEFFAALKERIVPLMKRIAESKKTVRTDFMTRLCPISEQEEFSRYLMEIQGLRKTATVLMTTEHPFTTHFGPKDVRVTTHYYEDNFISNIFSTLHEDGHALFMQNEPEEFYKEFVSDGMSNAMHECISRFYENIIGRSEAFIHFIYPKLLEISGDTFSDITEREIYEAVNASTPGLIRMEADELTYCLHIMIRYELEKDFVNGNISVDEIPELWNKKYKEYLGVDVPGDEKGCLQDVHWTSGYGYFPSYALGNAYGAQILNTMKKDFDVFDAVSKGELDKVLSWLKENVFSIASVTDPDEWINKITGESLNVKYYLDYLEEKFSEIYDLV